MATKGNPGENKTKGSLSIFIVFGLCCFFFVLGAWQRSGFGKGDSIAVEITKQSDCTTLSSLKYETHDGSVVDKMDGSAEPVKVFEPCGDQYIDHTPCQEQNRAMTFPRENMNYRERHCPPEEEKLHCLIPAPKGYVTPFSWPKSRDYVPYANAPYKSLTIEKAIQNWIQYEGTVFRFPGGGTQFPHGADAYIDELASVIPFDNGMVRTALDTGCGVASFGAYLFKKNVIAMSFAPRDSHEAQVQFALERGVPAIIGVLGTIKLPYPARSFDMAHCSRCLIPWFANDGMNMMEVDRVLRPGGYWVLSGPPINWKINFGPWQRPREELEEEQRKIEEVAKLLCWEKKHEKGEIAIWQKRMDSESCREQESRAPMCKTTNPNDVWYKKMEVCVTPTPSSGSDDATAEWKSFPERLNAVPLRISSGSIPGISVETYQEDNKLWKKFVGSYKRVNKIIDTGRYRNIMDMNAGLGSFAAALESPKLWVMNVLPTIAEKDTLGVVFERGLIGIYHDWCEAFSTYPRTYDLIHANGVFSLYKNKINRGTQMPRVRLPTKASLTDLLVDFVGKADSSRVQNGMALDSRSPRCNAEDILLEMDRILRPEGAVIFRDKVDVIMKLKRTVSGMRWKTRMVDHEDGPLVPEKVLYAVKQYWVAGDNSTSSH